MNDAQIVRLLLVLLGMAIGALIAITPGLRPVQLSGEAPNAQRGLLVIIVILIVLLWRGAPFLALR